MTLYDPGLQPERTELAWRRTALAIAVGSLISMRVLPVMLGSALWILAGVAGLLVAGALWIAARARYRAAYRVLSSDGDHAALPDARLLAATTVFAMAVGLVAVTAVIATATASAIS